MFDGLLNLFNRQTYSASKYPPTNKKLLWIDTNKVTGGLKYYNGKKWVLVPVGYTNH